MLQLKPPDDRHGAGRFKGIEALGTPNTEEDLTKFFADLGRLGTKAGFQAGSLVVSRLQTLLDEEHEAKTGTRGAPEKQHQTAMLIDDALLALAANLAPAELERLTPKDSLHQTELGYPLTVVEACAFALNLTSKLGLDWGRDDVTPKDYLQFVDIMLQDGWDSKRAKAFYDDELRYTELSGAPVDGAWINYFVGQALTYTEDGGVHAYRRVPRNDNGEFEASAATYRLPEPKNGKPLVIGMLADWAGGTPECAAVLRELQKHKPDIVIHLGDTYYSGTPREANDYWLKPMKAAFPNAVLLQVPGNHDYYSYGGAGFFQVIDKAGAQNASYFVYRGDHWQIVGVDTGVLQNLAMIALGPEQLKRQMEPVMAFLTPDQVEWAHEQLRIGKEKGLKTIMVSHHQLFSRSAYLGLANAQMSEAMYLPDEMAGTFPWLTEFDVKSKDLPGHLPPNESPAANTRMLHQFPKELLEAIDIWFWGHEHSNALFKPYAGLKRARLIGNGLITCPVNRDAYAVYPSNGAPWGGPPEIVDGSKVSKGDKFWGLGFATVELHGEKAKARYFQVLDKTRPDGLSHWGAAEQYYEEEL